MIIEMILDALFNVFELLTTPINIPQFPAEVSSLLNSAFTYISSGIGILANYTHLSYLLVLLGIIVGIDVGISIYHFVMWVLKKIPLLGVS